MVRPGVCAPRRRVARARRVRSGCSGKSGNAPAPGPHGTGRVRVAAVGAFRRACWPSWPACVAFRASRRLAKAAARCGRRACRCSRRCAGSNRVTRGAFPFGLSPGVASLLCKQWCGAGIEPATAAFTALCSDRLSYPYKTSRIRTGVTAVSRLLSLAELSSSRSRIRRPGHTPRQRRAHRTGLGTRTAVVRPFIAPFCRRSPGGKSSGSFDPIHSRFPSVSARAEAPRHSAASAVLRISPLPRTAGPGASWREGNRRFFSCANAQNKTPPGRNPRAFARPREIGVTDLPCVGISLE